MEHRILILFAHPAYQHSKANKALIKAASGLPDLTIHDLYETYPDFLIDVEHEQQLLVDHDLIICQYPLFWYATPSLLKEWLDLVLAHNFAYGPEGTALQDKRLMCCLTTGGSTDAYSPTGMNGYRLPEFLRPMERTAVFCGMHWLPPFAVQNTFHQTQSQLVKHGADYAKFLTFMMEKPVNVNALKDAETINENFGWMDE